MAIGPESLAIGPESDERFGRATGWAVAFVLERTRLAVRVKLMQVRPISKVTLRMKILLRFGEGCKSKTSGSGSLR